MSGADEAAAKVSGVASGGVAVVRLTSAATGSSLPKP